MGFHQWPVNSAHNGPVTQKMFPFDDVIMHVIEYSHTDRITDFRILVIPQASS